MTQFHISHRPISDLRFSALADPHEAGRISDLNPSIRNPHSAFRNCRAGFTLLEVLVALAVLGIAITVVLQLFSADMKAIAASGDYVAAVTKAEVKMREILDDDALTEKSLSETTNDGYRTEVSVTETLKDRTENLQVIVLNISVSIHWTKGLKEKSLTLNTMRTAYKQI